ncbi:hypothetical protein AM571_CH02394 [Rhizobium etli 8C-3]|uniref:1-alkyl-2-acetylglycerophosphocholine esterase n=1 Tax=Rhizobium etli 8C-3 TaxID=538025 RepID=A0A1L5P4Y2_RHIET|nr:hypothetical protein [Rhizobium etli]APO75203.1 hypothetical protein AM571_CH02394 [Rhizobium etli 8C-3]
MPVGFAEGLSFDHTRTNWTGDGPRPLSWTMWYPAVDSANETLATEHPIFRLHPIAPDAALKNAGKPHPLVLLSHGSSGVTFGLVINRLRSARQHVLLWCHIRHPDHRSVRS